MQVQSDFFHIVGKILRCLTFESCSLRTTLSWINHNLALTEQRKMSGKSLFNYVQAKRQMLIKCWLSKENNPPPTLPPPGYQSRLVFCTFDNESYRDYLCASLPRPQTNRTCNPQACPQTRRWATAAPEPEPSDRKNVESICLFLFFSWLLLWLSERMAYVYPPHVWKPSESPTALVLR